MKTQKIASLALMFMLVLTVVPFALAEEVSDIELTEEIETMGILERAEYRFGQLSVSLENQIEYGKDILTELEVTDEVMSELEGYIIDLESLLEEAQTIDLTSEPADLAAEFFVIKDEAMSISKNFKNTMNLEVRSDEIAELKSNIAEMKELRKEQARLRIEEKKVESFSKRGIRLLEELGIEVDESTSSEETKALVKEALSALSEKEKAELKADLQAERETAKTELEAKKSEAKAKMETKKSEIKANIEAKRETMRMEFKANIEERKADMEENIAELKAGIQEGIAELKSKKLTK